MNYEVDFTQSSEDILLGLINHDNETSLTSADIILGNPSRITGEGWTRTQIHIIVLDKDGGVKEEHDLTYSRMTLNKLFNFTGLRLPNRYNDLDPALVPAAILDDIFTKHNVKLSPSEFTINKLSDDRYSIIANDDNLVYTGSFNGSILLDEVGSSIYKLYGQCGHHDDDTITLKKPIHKPTVTVSGVTSRRLYDAANLMSVANTASLISVKTPPPKVITVTASPKSKLYNMIHEMYNAPAHGIIAVNTYKPIQVVVSTALASNLQGTQIKMQESAGSRIVVTRPISSITPHTLFIQPYVLIETYKGIDKNE